MATDTELTLLLETLYASKNPTRRWLHRTRRDWIVAQLRERAQAGARRALEVGFGAGVYLDTLAELFAEAAATDVAEGNLRHAAAIAARHPNLTLLRDDILASALPERAFDVILCSEVIEHFPDSAGALAAMRRLIAPQGRLILSTPQRYSLLEIACRIALAPGVIKLVRRIYGEAVFETGHVNLLSARAVTEQIASAGFRVRERFSSGMYLPVVAEFGGERGLRLERWLEKRTRGGRMDWMLWTQYYVAEPA
jgi:SAM-dependent methyltransferase